MTIGYGPRIVTDGLVLALDAADRNSFDDDENLLTYSEQFNDASWFKNNYNVTANATSAPDGTLTADKLIAINASTFHDLFKSPGLSSNTYTLSIFAKAAEQSFIQLRIDDGVLSRVAMFNLSTGSVSSSSNVTSPTITSYPNGWYRCSITVTTNIINVVFNGFPTSSNATYSGDGVSGVFIWGAQFEYGSSASPYYATTSTAKNRGTILTDLTGNSNTGTLTNSPTYNSSNFGSIVFDGSNDGIQLPGTNLSLNQMTISSWNYSTNYNQNGFMFEKTTNNSVNTQYSLFFNGDNTIYYRTYGISPTGDLAVYTTSAGVVNNQWNNVVATFDGTNKRIYVNGVLAATSVTLSGTVTQNTTGAAYIGIYGNFAGYPFNGRISNTQIYNRSLTAAEIQQNFQALRGRFGI